MSDATRQGDPRIHWNPRRMDAFSKIDPLVLTSAAFLQAL